MIMKDNGIFEFGLREFPKDIGLFMKDLRMKTLLTLNGFTEKIGKSRKSSDDKYNLIMVYSEFLKLKPQRQDFLNFDADGNFIENHTKMFKGFVTCDEASNMDEKVYVAIKDNVRVYFAKETGVVIDSYKQKCDECTYNELAIFFNKINLEKPLVFNI